MAILETREQIEEFLAERRQRLREFETRGVEALSQYDIRTAFGGDAERALRESMQLVRNHISYAESKLAEMPKQERLL